MSLDSVGNSLHDLDFKTLKKHVIDRIIKPPSLEKILIEQPFKKEIFNTLLNTSSEKNKILKQILTKQEMIEYLKAFKLIRTKGIVPYDYVDLFDKFNETQLPDKDKFYSILNQTNITD